MRRPVVAERVELGDEMPELAVGVNEVVDAGRQQSLCMGRLTRMRTAGGLISGCPRVKSREKRLPLRIDRAGISLILGVELIDVLGVTAIYDVKRLHKWVEL